MKHKSPRAVKKEGNRSSNKGSTPVVSKPPFLGVFYASIIINALTIFGVLLLSKTLPPQIPLFYGLPEGEEQLTSRLGLVTAAFSSLIIVLLNALICTFLKKDFLRKTLIIVGFAVSLLSLITTTEIILLVGTFK